MLICSGFIIAQQAINPPLRVGKNITPTSHSSTKAVDYMEDFETGAPGMTTVNVDGSTDDLTHTQNIDFSAGWIFQLTFGTGHFAASNSVFSPDAACDRWMFTPEIANVSTGAELSWDAATILIAATPYASDYEIYVATSIAGANPAPSDFSTLITTITDEPLASAFTHRTADLSAYAGQNIWVAFRHVEVSADGTLGVDNIRVGSTIADDIVMLKPLIYTGLMEGYYGATPMTQVQVMQFGADVFNFGNNAQTNIVLNANVNAGLFNDNSTAYASLASGINDSIYAQNLFTLGATPEMYEAIFIITQTETDENPGNNTDTISFETTDDLYMRATAINTYCGLGSYAEAGAVIGTFYDFPVTDQIDSLFAFIADGSPAGATVTLKIFDALNSNVEVAATAAYTITAADETNGAYITLALPTPYITAPSLYVVGAELGGTGADLVELYGDNAGRNPAESVNHYIDPSGTGFSWYYFTGSSATVPVLGAIVHTPVDVNDVISELPISIFPNPTTGTLNITNAENADVVIYNMLGEVVLSVNNITRIIDISKLAGGTYIVKVVSENNVTTQKVNLIK